MRIVLAVLISILTTGVWAADPGPAKVMYCRYVYLGVAAAAEATKFAALREFGRSRGHYSTGYATACRASAACRKAESSVDPGAISGNADRVSEALVEAINAGDGAAYDRAMAEVANCDKALGITASDLPPLSR